MKYQLIGIQFLFILLSISGCSSSDVVSYKGRNESKTLEQRMAQQFDTDLNHYFKSMNNYDIDQVVEMTYPKLYGQKGIKGAKENYIMQKARGLQKKVYLKQINKVSSIIETDEKYYAIIEATGDASLTLDPILKEHKAYIQNSFELSYDMKCSFETDTELRIEDAHLQFIAISEKGSNYYWQYIEVDRQKLPYYNQIIPEKVLAEI